jgi:AcrR family transcriptional regulator
MLMMSTSVSNVKSGRTGQKARTRTALIESARALLGAGTTPTVESAAARAGISRATAYRYFTNQQELLVATHPMLDMPSLLPPDPPADPAERVELVAKRILELTLDTEAELRMALRLSLDPQASRYLPLRTGRRLNWFQDALRPLRGQLRSADLRRLSLALAASVGIEAWIWLIDVVGLSRKQAAEQLLWTARSLTRAQLEPR